MAFRQSAVSPSWFPIKSLSCDSFVSFRCLFVASKTAIARAFVSSHKETQETQKRTDTETNGTVVIVSYIKCSACVILP